MNGKSIFSHRQVRVVDRIAPVVCQSSVNFPKRWKCRRSHPYNEPFILETIIEGVFVQLVNGPWPIDWLDGAVEGLRQSLSFGNWRIAELVLLIRRPGNASIDEGDGAPVKAVILLGESFQAESVIEETVRHSPTWDN